MPRRRRTSFISNFIRALFILGLIGAAAIFILWAQLTAQDRYLFSLLVLIFLLLGAAIFILLAIYSWRRRTQAWQRAMEDWNDSQGPINAPAFSSARSFTPAQLEKFTAQLFRQMGYRVAHTGHSGDHGVDVRLVNPAGQVELVQCKQWNKPVGEPEVRDLAGAMLHEKAVRGFIIAPGGFSESARSWARGKKISLVDERELGRLVQSVYGNRTHFSN